MINKIDQPTDQNAWELEPLLSCENLRKSRYLGRNCAAAVDYNLRRLTRGGV